MKRATVPGQHKGSPELGWRPVWDMDAALRATAEWYSAMVLESRQIDSRSSSANIWPTLRRANRRPGTREFLATSPTRSLVVETTPSRTSAVLSHRSSVNRIVGDRRYAPHRPDQSLPHSRRRRASRAALSAAPACRINWCSVCEAESSTSPSTCAAGRLPSCSGTLKNFRLRMPACLLIPEGFAHGFQALESDSELLYFHLSAYAPAVEAGVHFDDRGWRSDGPAVTDRLPTR